MYHPNIVKLLLLLRDASACACAKVMEQNPQGVAAERTLTGEGAEDARVETKDAGVLGAEDARDRA